MARPPLENINPLDIYMHALGFHVSETALGAITMGPDEQLGSQVVEAAMVLSAFTTELFLKCLICLETKLTPPSHHLFELFEQLRPATKTKITHLWDTQILPVRDPQWTFLENSQGNIFKISRDLPGALTASSRAFEKIRYAYEPGSRDDSNFNVADLPRVLRRVILEMKPEWITLGRSVNAVPGFSRGGK